MSAIEALLGPRPGAHAAHHQLTQAPRTLLVGSDVLIHLQEDESRGEVTLYSVPGYMQEGGWLSERTETWSHVLPHPEHEQVLCALVVEPGTREVFLAETWPRAALDQVTLGQQLNAHAERHRLWQRFLLLAHEDGFGIPASL